MEFDLSAARGIGSFVRYSEDPPSSFENISDEQSDLLKNSFYQNGLLVDARSAPKINKIAEKVISRLCLPSQSVSCFVFSNSEIQATCFSLSDVECVIHLSSGLVRLLSDDELAFVIGHELGHFILGHQGSDGARKSAEDYMHQRNQEISVDRIGLLACNNINSAVKALIKTISGLDERHLGFDVGQFISQVNNQVSTNSGASLADSHPSLVIRCRALLLFSSSNVLSSKIDEIERLDFTTINLMVKKEMDKYVDAPLRSKIREIAEDLFFWKASQIVFSAGSFSKENQSKFNDQFGGPMTQKLIDLLSSYSKSEISSMLDQRTHEACDQLERIIPRGFENEYEKIVEKCENLLESSSTQT